MSTTPITPSVPAISYEVFPPKTPAGLEQLRGTVERLARTEPVFVSVTYGAGGTDRHRSFDAIDAVAASGVRVAGHLTCVGQTVADVDAVLAHYAARGVTDIVALRGDPPHGIDAPYEAHPEGYQRTADLVATASRGFAVSVSAYPERHPQSPTDDHDLAVLAEKVAAGARRAITQMCFDDDALLRYRDRVAAAGIDVAIVPGIFPIHDLAAVTRFATRCGATMPDHVAARFDGVDPATQPDAARRIAADVAAGQIAHLAAHGIDHVHVYTLNRAELALAVAERLGIVHAAAA